VQDGAARELDEALRPVVGEGRQPLALAGAQDDDLPHVTHSSSIFLGAAAQSRCFISARAATH
jgi:hypothetical protein